MTEGRMINKQSNNKERNKINENDLIITIQINN